jgi:hypothetical protein
MNWKRVLIGEWNWKRPIKSVVWIYLILCFIAVFFADRILFIPPVSSYGADLDGLFQLRTEEGEGIASIYYPAPEGMPTLLYSHGNAEDLGQALELYQTWRGMGFGVMAYDYPGYGESAGTPSEASCKRAIHTAWKHLRGLGVPAKSIVIVGRSVGGGPSTWLAAGEKPAGLVLIAPFTSVFRVAFPFPLFPRDRFQNLKLICEMDTPLLVIHGENDEVIPVSHGRTLVSASAAVDKVFISISDAGHNDLFEVAGDEIVGKVGDFARRVAK